MLKQSGDTCPMDPLLSPVEFHRSRQAVIVLLCGTVICKWLRTLCECNNIVRDMKYTIVSTVVTFNSQ